MVRSACGWPAEGEGAELRAVSYELCWQQARPAIGSCYGGPFVRKSSPTNFFQHMHARSLLLPLDTTPARLPTMPKAPKSPGLRDQRHNPLAEEYAPSDPFKSKPAKRQKRTTDDAAEEQTFVDSKSSRKILDIGRELEEEDERETQARRPQDANPAFDFESRVGADDVVIEELEPFQDDDDEAWGEDDDEVEEVEIDASDLAAWNKFIPTDDNPIVWPGEEAQPSGPGTDLAALILEKIAAHEAGGGQVQLPEIQGGGAPEDAIELPAKVVEGTWPLLQPLTSLLTPIQSTQRSASS